MNLNLSDRVALVTGSSSGLGLEIARVLGENEAEIILCGRNLEKLKIAGAIVGRLNPHKVHLKSLDATKKEDIDDLFCALQYGLNPKMDILINNIGGAPVFGSFEDLTSEDWHRTIELNVMTTVNFTKAALPLLKKSQHGGRIINISSFVALMPGRFNPDYAFCKAGIVNFTKYIARNYGKFGISSVVICPNTLMGGGLERNASDRAAREGISVEKAREKIIENAKKKNPLGKVGELADVANLVAFLVSDAGQFINGQCIAVDGGGEIWGV